MTLHVRPFLILTVLLLTCSRGYPQQTGNNQGVLIDELLKEVQMALARAQTDLRGENIPPLKSVTLDLTAEVKQDATGKINLFIVSFGHDWEKTRSQEVEVTLEPPKPGRSLPIPKGPSMSDELVQAIESGARGIQTARVNKDVPLVASDLKVTLSFVVKGGTSGGAKFEIVPVTVDLSGDLANSAVQKIIVVYQNPKPKK